MRCPECGVELVEVKKFEDYLPGITRFEVYYVCPKCRVMWRESWDSYDPSHVEIAEAGEEHYTCLTDKGEQEVYWAPSKEAARDALEKLGYKVETCA